MEASAIAPSPADTHQTQAENGIGVAKVRALVLKLPTGNYLYGIRPQVGDIGVESAPGKTMIRHMTIRPALLRDAHAIARIYVESWRSAYQGILPRRYLAGLSIEQTLRSVRRNLTNSLTSYLIAEGDPGVVGYISAGAEREQDPIYAAEIYELYLLPDMQRQGLGKELLAHMAGRLYREGFYTLMAWVLTRNPSRRFYEKCGGIYLRTKTILHAGRRLQTDAYGWIDITLAI
jgi:GNAT superfamily N-acetyltransferase